MSTPKQVMEDALNSGSPVAIHATSSVIQASANVSENGSIIDTTVPSPAPGA